MSHSKHLQEPSFDTADQPLFDRADTLDVLSSRRSQAHHVKITHHQLKSSCDPEAFSCMQATITHTAPIFSQGKAEGEYMFLPASLSKKK
jgi:hypothetical protein